MLNFQYSVLFLLLSLLIIIILYYIQKKNMDTLQKENYHSNKERINGGVQQSQQSLPHRNSFGTNSNRFCDDNYKFLDGMGSIIDDPTENSLHKKITGDANPKTKIMPIIAPRSHDLSYWKATNLTNHSAINKESQVDSYYSGVKETDCNHNEIYNSLNISEYPQEHNNDTFENYNTPPYKINYPNDLASINTSCGYDQFQVKDYGLPSNFPGKKCDRNEYMKNYNENLYTHTIQPGIYTRSDIIEPINSNIGISFNQQFPTVTFTKNKQNGTTNYTEHDPIMFNQNTDNNTEHDPIMFNQNTDNNLHIQSVSETDIYDPRFNGYGTSYRAYEDEFIGQTRFYYDDINAVRMPNYITRSNIDNLPFADKYGPIPEGHSNGNSNTCNMRKLANNGFLNSALQHRADISQKLMRKRNNELSQRRQAPIRTGGQRMLGGMMKV